MRYERTDHFKADYQRLSQPERDLFAAAVRSMNEAAGSEQDPGRISWPASLRIKSVKGAPGVMELTWSFAGPDRRATFTLERMDGLPGVRWRRIGTHAIFLAP